MHGREHAGRDLGGVPVDRSGLAAADEHDAGGLGLDLDRPVEVEVPEEAVVVVADRGEVRHHQASRTTHVRADRAGLGVLPQHAVVLFVHADGIGDAHRVTVIVGDVAVEVVDDAEAVAPELEVVGVLAEQVLAGVEIADPESGVAGVAVGHDHLGHARPREHGAVVEAHVVQHESLAGVEVDAQRPVLPLHVRAGDREARPLGLGDLDRLQRRARGSGGRGLVPAAAGGCGHVALVLDADHPVRGEVDVHDQALDGVRPRDVVLAVAEEGERADDAAPDLVLTPDEPRGERGAERQVDAVGEPATLHRGPPLGRGLDQFGGALVLLEQVLRLTVGGGVGGVPTAAHHLARGDRDDRLGHLSGRGVEQRDVGAAVEGVSRMPRGHGRLLGFGGQQHGHPHGFAEQARRDQDVARALDLLRAQRVEGMRRRPGPRRGLEVGVLHRLVDGGVSVFVHVCLLHRPPSSPGLGRGCLRVHGRCQRVRGPSGGETAPR